MDPADVELDYAELRAAATVLRDSADELETRGQALDAVPTSGAVYAHAGLTDAATRVAAALRDRQAALTRSARTIADAVDYAREAFEAADRAEAEALTLHGSGRGNAPRPV